MSDFRPDIWRLQASFDTQGLIDALSNSDAGVRRRAAAALRALGAVEAVPALKTALDKEQDTDTRSNIVAALAALEHEKDRAEAVGENQKSEILLAGEFESLIRQLDTPQTEKVVAAALRLGELRDKRAVEPLVMLFNNAKVDIKIRLAVAEALLKLESAPVEVALLGALRSPNWRIRRNGAAILGQLKAEWAIDPLAKAMLDENDTVRKTARAALKHINTAESRAALGISDGRTSEKTTPNRKTGMLTRLPTTGTLRSPSTAPTPPAPSPALTTAQTMQTVESPTVVTSETESAPVKPSEPAVSPAPASTASPASTVPPTAAPASATQAAVQSATQSAAQSATATQTSQQVARPVWPKKPEPAPEEDPSKIPTRPLDPRRLEEAEERLNRQKPNDTQP